MNVNVTNTCSVCGPSHYHPYCVIKNREAVHLWALWESDWKPALSCILIGLYLIYCVLKMSQTQRCRSTAAFYKQAEIQCVQQVKMYRFTQRYRNTGIKCSIKWWSVLVPPLNILTCELYKPNTNACNNLFCAHSSTKQKYSKAVRHKTQT